MARTKAADKATEKLYKDLSSEVRRANAKLQRLKGHGLDRESFAGKKLFDRLEHINGLTEAGNIRYAKDLTKPQATAILKAVKQYNNSKTSTVKGIQEVSARLKKDLRKAGVGASGKKLTVKQANALYKVLEDKNIQLEGSIKYEVSVIANEVLENNGTDADFLNKVFKNILDPSGINDMDLRKELTKVFDTMQEGAPAPKKARKPKTKTAPKKPVKTDLSTRKSAAKKTPGKKTLKKSNAPKPKPVKTDISTRKSKK